MAWAEVFLVIVHAARRQQVIEDADVVITIGDVDVVAVKYKDVAA